MPSIPLPFVIALLLGLILVRMTRHVGWEFGLFSLLVATFAAQAILSGLNWNFGWYPARFSRLWRLSFRRFLLQPSISSATIGP
jgi:hypothetical protein